MGRHQPEFVDLATYRGAHLTVSALAAWLECDTRTVIRMIQAKTLTAVKVGREWRIPTESARVAFHVQAQRNAT